MALLIELRYAIRTLRRAPRFTAVSIVVLALGVGANATLFSIADAVLLRPFPFTHADQFVIAGENLIEPRSEITYRDFLAWRETAQTFDDMAAIGSSNWSWRLRTDREQIEVRYRAVSGHFFDVIGASARVGRTLRAEDDRRDAARVVVLSHGFWSERRLATESFPFASRSAHRRARWAGNCSARSHVCRRRPPSPRSRPSTYCGRSPWRSCRRMCRGSPTPRSMRARSPSRARSAS